MAIAGASRYLGAATLANTRGISAAQPGLISNLGTVSLLDVGRSAGGDFGVGLSGRARQLNKQFLESTASTFNSIFSLNVSQTSSIEGLQLQIRALRASLPESSLGADFFAEDNGEVSESATGQVVDTEA